MRTSIKLLLWLFAGIGTLLAVLVASLFLVDANLYRTQIEQRVSMAFGREVVFAGSLRLEPSLVPRFAVEDLKIANPQWASRPFLAMVDKFDIRVSLLPLLRGELNIVSLEFHGVDLLLEKTSEGIDNFTFGETGEAGALPAIERMSLYDAVIAYAGPAGPPRRLHLAQVSARNVPGRPVELQAQTTVNEVPVTVSLRGEPPGDSHPAAPWKITLLGEAGNLSLRAEGSVSAPTDWQQGEYRLDLKGRNLDDLEALSGYPLPALGPIELGADVSLKRDEYLTVSDLTAQLGGSDMRGHLHWEMSAARHAIKVQLESQQLRTDDLGLAAPLTGNADQGDTHFLDEPLDLGPLDGVDLNVEIQVRRLDGLARPLQDIVLIAGADQQRLELASIEAKLDDMHFAANGALPWGGHLTTLASDGVSVKTLLQHAELDIRMRAPDAGHHYAATLLGHPIELTLSGIEATARPNKALTIRAEAALNEKPVNVTLKSEALADLLQRPTGPWKELALEVRGDDIRLDATGSVARPFAYEGFDVSYALSGPDIDILLPLQGDWSLAGHYAGGPGRHEFDELKLTLGRSDIDGHVAIYKDGQRTRLVANLDAGLLDMGEMLPDRAGATPAGDSLNQPLDVAGLDVVDLDVVVRVRRLEGLAKPMQNILLTANTSGQDLTLAPLRATLEGARVDARVELPWGERLAALGNNGISVQRLAQHADLALQGQVPDGKLQREVDVVGHSVDLRLASFDVSARPGKPLQVNAKANIDDKPVQVELRAEPLAQLLQRPKGPWKDLALKFHGKDIRFEASGRIERPLEASGFDIHYALRGAQIDTLLPLFDLVLPLEGAYSLTGHFADLPDRFVFDELEIRSGASDIGGQISVYQGERRPRVVAKLSSEQIYLSKLLPVNETGAAPDAERLVIPDYDLPIERMREIDGELRFHGKRLRTTAGDLGDISFRATLKDGVFRMDPFTVRGWAGAFIESDGLIDTSQEPPIVQWNWIARELNYGVLLEQAGFAETVEGTLDVTLRLSAKGRTRREFLSTADGRLIIVGKEGKFGSRRLDLWGSDLVTTMLSRQWRREDVTDLNCVVAQINIEDGVASSDEFIVDTQRITIAATGTLDLEREALNLVFAPRPKRASLVSLTNPVHVSGTLSTPEVAVTVLPRNRMAAAGGGLLAGLINPAYLIFTFSQAGSGQANACAAAVEQAMAMKAAPVQTDTSPTVQPERFSLLPGCTRARRPSAK